MNLNKVQLIGRCGKDPEIRSIADGAKVANFSLATSEKYKDKEVTEWHSIVLWKGLAEVAEKYVHKGDLLYIEGKIRTRSWDDKDGNKRYTTEIVGNEMIMLGSKKPAAPPESDQDFSDSTTKPDDVPTDESDLPF
jgi:single-strand DNA-binding protein